MNDKIGKRTYNRTANSRQVLCDGEHLRGCGVDDTPDRVSVLHDPQALHEAVGIVIVLEVDPQAARGVRRELEESVELVLQHLLVCGKIVGDGNSLPVGQETVEGQFVGHYNVRDICQEAHAGLPDHFIANLIPYRKPDHFGRVTESIKPDEDDPDLCFGHHGDYCLARSFYLTSHTFPQEIRRDAVQRVGRSHVHAILESLITVVEHAAILLALYLCRTVERGLAVFVAIALGVDASIACCLTNRFSRATAEITEILLQQPITFFRIGTSEAEVHIERVYG